MGLDVYAKNLLEDKTCDNCNNDSICKGNEYNTCQDWTRLIELDLEDLMSAEIEKEIRASIDKNVIKVIYELAGKVR